MKEITAGIELLRKDMAEFIDEEAEFDIKQQGLLLGKLKTQIIMRWIGGQNEENKVCSLTRWQKFNFWISTFSYKIKEVDDEDGVLNQIGFFSGSFFVCSFWVVMILKGLSFNFGFWVGLRWMLFSSLISAVMVLISVVYKALSKMLVIVREKAMEKARNIYREEKKSQQLSADIIKLENDSVFFLTEVQQYFQEMVSSFRERLFGLEAQFKATTIELRERAKQTVVELTVECDRLKFASDKEIADRKFILEIAQEKIEEYKKMIANIDPQEGSLLNMFRSAGSELETLNRKMVSISDEKRRYELANEVIARLEKYGTEIEKLKTSREGRLRDIGLYLANLTKYIRAADRLLGEINLVLPSVEKVSLAEMQSTPEAELPPTVEISKELPVTLQSERCIEPKIDLDVLRSERHGYIIVN